MTTIRINAPQKHPEIADVEIGAASRSLNGDGTYVISDGTALTIAAWYQSPGSQGSAFATLASTGKVDKQALKEEIERERVIAVEARDWLSRDRMDVMAAWVRSR
jgi:hypothetical protein